MQGTCRVTQESSPAGEESSEGTWRDTAGTEIAGEERLGGPEEEVLSSSSASSSGARISGT